MPERTEPVSTEVSYETDYCVHCETEVTTEETGIDVPEPRGMALAIGSTTSVYKDKITVRGDPTVEYVCPTCATTIYERTVDNSGDVRYINTVDPQERPLLPESPNDLDMEGWSYIAIVIFFIALVSYFGGLLFAL